MELAMGNRPMTGGAALAFTTATVTVRYSPAGTAFEVRVPGQADPVARVTKESNYSTPRPFQVHTGPGPGEFAGYVTPFAAYGPDRTKLGTIKSRHRVLRPDRWQVDQPGLGVLPAHPAGPGRIRYVFPFSLVLSGNVTNAVLPFIFRFRSARSAGFTVHRKAGLRARFTVAVHAPEVDRLIVLATVVALNQFESTDLRQEAVDLAGPFTT
jgi:hypothetical protein